LFDAFVPLQAMRQISPLKNKVWIYLFAFAATIKKEHLDHLESSS
jgi:hypothetical protein